VHVLAGIFPAASREKQSLRFLSSGRKISGDFAACITFSGSAANGGGFQVFN